MPDIENPGLGDPYGEEQPASQVLLTPEPVTPVVIAPKVGIAPPKGLSDYGQLLHTITLALVPTFVALGLATQDNVTTWVALFFAVVDPLFSTISTPDKVRAVIYGLGGASQAALIGLGVLDNATAPVIVGSVVTILTATLATFYTPTSKLVVNASQE